MLEGITGKLQSNLKIYRKEYRKKGVKYIILARLRKFISDPLSYLYYKYGKSKRSFTFQGNQYKYIYSKYNFTWVNERAIEIPLFWEIVRKNRRKKILEVGNVLSHYYPVSHDVLDKYEIAEGVMNEDVKTFTTDKRYDVIISISTLEHVGWDERPREHNKILPSLKNLISLLKPHGMIIFTVPIGYNDDLQKHIQKNNLPLTQRIFMKRISDDNAWVESEWSQVRNARYNTPFPNANAIMIGIIKN